MAPERYVAAGSRLPNTIPQDIQRLHGRVERRRPKPKNKHPPEYYRDLIERHNNPKAVIKTRYADTTKDNLRNIRGKFTR
jgi:hypothetical protein